MLPSWSDKCVTNQVKALQVQLVFVDFYLFWPYSLFSRLRIAVLFTASYKTHLQYASVGMLWKTYAAKSKET